VGILTTKRERDLVTAAQYRRAVENFVAENDPRNIEANAGWLRNLVEEAERLEGELGVAHPAGFLNSADPGVRSSLRTSRETDLDQAAKIRAELAELEKRDPKGLRANRGFFQGSLQHAEDLELKHGVVATPPPLQRTKSSAGGPSLSAAAAASVPIGPLAFDPGTEGTPTGRRQVIDRAIAQGRLRKAQVFCDMWDRALREDPAGALIQLNALPPSASFAAMCAWATPELLRDKHLPCLFFVRAAVREDRIFAAEEDYWTACMEVDPEAAVQALKSKKPGEAGGAVLMADAARGASGLTEDESKVCEQLGLTAAQFLAGKDPA